MGTVTPITDARLASSERGGPRPPALGVTIDTGAPDDDLLGIISIRLRVRGGRLPVRLYLYVDGDLAEAWTESAAEFDMALDDHGPGRHAVTARAVDALGRWAGASVIVTCLADPTVREAR
jgi:hypothetical protein